MRNIMKKRKYYIKKLREIKINFLKKDRVGLPIIIKLCNNRVSLSYRLRVNRFLPNSSIHIATYRLSIYGGK